MPEIKATSKTIKIKYNGKSHEIKMYYGLLSELLELVSDLSNVGNLFTVTETRNKALQILLSERDNLGTITLENGPKTVDIDYEEVEKLLSWAATHVTGFFVRSLKRLTENLAETFGTVDENQAETPSTLPPIGSVG